MKTLQWLLASLPDYGNRRAIGMRGHYGFRWYSYETIYKDALRAATVFARRGLHPGQRILLWSANSPEWVACLLGAALRGLVLVPVDAGASREDVMEMARRTEAALLLTGAAQQPAGLAIPAVALGGLGTVSPDSFEALRVAIQSSEPAAILFTAGTSTEPRGVILTHGNIECQVEHFGYWRPILRLAPTRILALSPLSHIQGLMLGACVPLSLGMTVIYSASIEPEHLQRTLREGRVRVLGTVPRVLAALSAAVSSKQEETRLPVGIRLRWRVLGSTFKVILVGGATLPTSQENFWRKLGCVVVQGYGSTETTAFVTVNRPLIGRRGSIGRMVHQGSVTLSDDGEILVRGPHVSPGYLGESGELAKNPGGFIHTGDLAQRDAQGRLFFLGRLQDRIVTGEGNTLYPDPIEVALREISGVRDAVVMPAVRDGLEEVHAVLLTDSELAAGAVGEANAKLPAPMRIRSWTVWPLPDFPRGALGKPLRAQIVSQVTHGLMNGHPPRRGDSQEPPSLGRALNEQDRQLRLQRVCDVLIATGEGNRDFLDLLEKLQPMGMDSIDVAELAHLLRRKAIARASEEPPALPQRGPYQSTGAVRQTPQWQYWPGAGILRTVLRSAVLFFARYGAGIKAHRTGKPLPRDTGPTLFAVSREDRQHSVEFLAILMALPERFRRRVIVTIGDILFEPYFYRRPQDSMLMRWKTAFDAHFGTSSVVPYILAPGGTAIGIGENCRAIDAGFSPLMTWSRLSASVACETGTRVIPIRMYGRRRSYFDADMEIEFGSPVEPLRYMSAAQFELVIDRHFGAMEQRPDREGTGG